MEKNSYSGVSGALPRRFLLPIALYESNGLIFELYYGGRSLHDGESTNGLPRHKFSLLPGGQPFTRRLIRWVHLATITDPDCDPLAKQGPRR